MTPSEVSDADARFLEQLRAEEPEYQTLIGDREATREAARRLLDHEGEPVGAEGEELRSRALYVLSAVDPEGALSHLTAASSSSSAMVRSAAIGGLASVVTATRERKGLLQPLETHEVISLASQSGSPAGLALRNLASVALHDTDAGVKMACLSALTRSVAAMDNSGAQLRPVAETSALDVTIDEDGQVPAPWSQTVSKLLTYAERLAKEIDAVDTP